MSTFDKVQKIISENLSVEESQITMDTSILGDLGADSLDVMETFMSIENDFDIKFSENEVKEIQNIGDLVRLIDAKLGEK